MKMHSLKEMNLPAAAPARFSVPGKDLVADVFDSILAVFAFVLLVYGAAYAVSDTAVVNLLFFQVDDPHVRVGVNQTRNGGETPEINHLGAGGMAASPAPTLLMRSFSTMTTAFVITLPAPSTSRPKRNALIGALAVAVCQTGGRTSAIMVPAIRISNSFMLFDGWELQAGSSYSYRSRREVHPPEQVSEARV
jgi:hypothetical protein